MCLGKTYSFLINTLIRIIEDTLNQMHIFFCPGFSITKLIGTGTGKYDTHILLFPLVCTRKPQALTNLEVYLSIKIHRGPGDGQRREKWHGRQLSSKMWHTDGEKAQKILRLCNRIFYFLNVHYCRHVVANNNDLHVILQAPSSMHQVLFHAYQKRCLRYHME